MKKIIITGIAIFIVFSSFRITPQPGLDESVERGRIVYLTACLACHQQDGEGVQRMNPPLVKTKWVLGEKKALIKIVLNGLKGGEIEIDGDHFHNPMPAQAGLLSDQQIADVLTFVRKSFGNNASAVKPAEVKKARGIEKTVSAKPIKKNTKQ